MSIRGWFGYTVEYKFNATNSIVDELLELYSLALSRYFSTFNTSNINELITLAKLKNNSPGDILFLEWLDNTAVSYLQNLASFDYSNDEKIVNQLKYEKYILEAEMDFEFPDDVRACMVNIGNGMPKIIRQLNEVSATVEDDVTGKNCKGSDDLPKEQGPLYETTIKRKFTYVKKENPYNMSNKKESVEVKLQVLFLI